MRCVSPDGQAGLADQTIDPWILRIQTLRLAFDFSFNRVFAVLHSFMGNENVSVQHHGESGSTPKIAYLGRTPKWLSK